MSLRPLLLAATLVLLCYVGDESNPAKTGRQTTALAPPSERAEAPPVNEGRERLLADLAVAESRIRADDPQDYPRVVEILRNPDPEIRWAALAVLRLYLHASVYPTYSIAEHLNDMENDPSAENREAAVWLMLEAVQERAARWVWFRASLDRLRQTDPVPEVRQAAETVRQQVTPCFGSGWGPRPREVVGDPVCEARVLQRMEEVRRRLDELKADVTAKAGSTAAGT